MRAAEALERALHDDLLTYLVDGALEAAVGQLSPDHEAQVRHRVRRALERVVGGSRSFVEAYVDYRRAYARRGRHLMGCRVCRDPERGTLRCTGYRAADREVTRLACAVQSTEQALMGGRS